MLTYTKKSHTHRQAGFAHQVAIVFLLVGVVIGGIGSYIYLASSGAAPEPALKRITHVHDSGRYDRPVSLLIADAHKDHKLSSIISRTELSNTARFNALRTEVLKDDWSIIRMDGAGPNESSLEWDNTVWKQVGAKQSKQLSSATYKTESGTPFPYFRTSAVTLQRVNNSAVSIRIFSVHMPLRNTQTRREVWASVMKGLTNTVVQYQKANPRMNVMVTGDWNANWRNSGERSLLSRFASTAGLTPTWASGRLPSSGGTIGSRVIDMSFVKGSIVSAKLLPDTSASDHRAFVEVIGLKY